MKLVTLFSRLFSSFRTFKTSAISIIIFLSIFTLVVDTSIDQIYYLNINEYPLDAKVILFMIIAIITLIGQYAFLQFVRNKSIDIRKANILNIRTLSKIAYVIQSLLTMLFLIVIFQTLIETQYNVVMLIISTGVSSFFGGSMMLLLATKFFSWFNQIKILSCFYMAHRLRLLR